MLRNAILYNQTHTPQACASIAASLFFLLLNKLPPVHTATGSTVTTLTIPKISVAVGQPSASTTKPASSGPTIHPAAQATLNKL